MEYEQDMGEFKLTAPMIEMDEIEDLIKCFAQENSRLHLDLERNKKIGEELRERLGPPQNDIFPLLQIQMNLEELKVKMDNLWVKSCQIIDKLEELEKCKEG